MAISGKVAMNLIPALKKFAVLALFALPAVSFAATYTLTIDGVDPNSPPDVLAPGYAPSVLPGMFVALGNCVATPGAPNQCDGVIPVDLNTLATPQDVLDNNAVNGINSTNAVIFGYGLKQDQLIFHLFQSNFDFTNGVVTTPGGVGLGQTFDFLVGGTGGGSAGLDPNGSITYQLDFARNVTVSGGSLNGPMSQLVHQHAELTIGWTFDTLMIFQSDLVDFDLGNDGHLQFRLLAEGPIQQGDPIIPIAFNNVPAPSTLALALLGLGLAGMSRRKARVAT
jgi:PEP-CTERM motif